MVFGSGFDFPPPTTLFLATIHTDPPWNDGLDAPMSCGRNLGRSRDGTGEVRFRFPLEEVYPTRSAVVATCGI